MLRVEPGSWVDILLDCCWAFTIKWMGMNFASLTQLGFRAVLPPLDKGLGLGTISPLARDLALPS